MNGCKKLKQTHRHQDSALVHYEVLNRRATATGAVKENIEEE